jgi:hypothetical protein
VRSQGDILERAADLRVDLSLRRDARLRRLQHTKPTCDARIRVWSLKRRALSNLHELVLALAPRSPNLEVPFT